MGISCTENLWTYEGSCPPATEGSKYKIKIYQNNNKNNNNNNNNNDNISY